MATRFYLGRKHGHTGRVVFKADTTPTKEAYPQFVSVVGPFRTRRGAVMMALVGDGNPHMQTVSDAERIAKPTA